MSPPPASKGGPPGSVINIADRHAWRRRTPRLLLALLALGAATQTAAALVTSQPARITMSVGQRRFSITLADNPAARALAAQLPLTLEMAELNGNEKHADLRQALPASARVPPGIENGDLMLFGSHTLVLFYSAFSSSYAYTRLGRVDAPADLPQALGGRAVTVVFSKH